jgi:hypothetical protein
MLAKPIEGARKHRNSSSIHNPIDAALNDL